MVSNACYNAILDAIKKKVGESAFEYIYPSIVKALEVGNGKVREEILIDFLNLDCVRVCTTCGAIMEEGWYLDSAGYACSDKCAAKSEGISMEQFRKWRIYKDDIIEYLKMENKGRNIEDLSKEECEKIISYVAQYRDYCYTCWY